MYVLWDVIGMLLFDCRWSIIKRAADDTIARKVNSSDASAFAKICGCFPSQGTSFSSTQFLSENNFARQFGASYG